LADIEIPKDGHGAWHGGKGSAPKDSDQTKYADNYDRIFGKKEKAQAEVEPVKNDGPPIPNGLKAAWERQRSNLDKKK
jgi:hypothetical protein